MATEKRLIDANELKKKANMNGHPVRPMVTAYHMCVSVKDIDNAPTVDAVEVVRCKDCRWFNPKKLQDKGICDHPTTGILIPEENDFCSYGAKMDGDGNV